MEIEACDGWKAFKEFWHLDFLYKEVELALLKTKAKMDDKVGTLKLTQDLLIFEGDDPKHSKNIPIGSIETVEKDKNSFSLKIKKKFLLIVFKTPVDDIWVDSVQNAMNGIYKKADVKFISESITMKEEELARKEKKVKEYIRVNFTEADKSKAMSYYYKYLGCSMKEAKDAVDEIFDVKKLITTYPGTEALEQGLFEGQPVVFFSGDGKQGFLILTKRELVEINTKKNKEVRYDIYKMSHMKSNVLGCTLTFRYPKSVMEKNINTQGFNADVFIAKIKDLQKGTF